MVLKRAYSWKGWTKANRGWPFHIHRPFSRSNHKTTDALKHCCWPKSKVHNSVGELNVISLTQPTLQPWQWAPWKCWIFLLIGPGQKDYFCEFKTFQLHHTIPSLSTTRPSKNGVGDCIFMWATAVNRDLTFRFVYSLCNCLDLHNPWRQLVRQATSRVADGAQSLLQSCHSTLKPMFECECACVHACACVCVCVCARERARARVCVYLVFSLSFFVCLDLLRHWNRKTIDNPFMHSETSSAVWKSTE